MDDATLVDQAAQQLNEQKEQANIAITYLQNKLPDIMDFGIKVLIAFVIFAIGKKVITILRRMVRKSFDRAGVETGTVNFIDSLVKGLLYVVLIASIAVHLGVKEGSITALLGSMGVGIVLALKESLSNIAGGFILLVMKPFVVGDYIKENGSGTEGTVQRIDLFYTTLVTLDNSLVNLPNGSLSNSSLVNLSRQEKRQLQETVGISYDADIKRAKGILENILIEDEKVLKDQPISVYVSQLADSAVVLGFGAWVMKDDLASTKWRVLEKIKYKFDAEGVEIPYNQMEVIIKENQQTKHQNKY